MSNKHKRGKRKACSPRSGRARARGRVDVELLGLGKDGIEACRVPDKVDTEAASNGPARAGRIDSNRAETSFDEGVEDLRVARRGVERLILCVNDYQVVVDGTGCNWGVADLVRQDGRKIDGVSIDASPCEGLRAVVGPALGAVWDDDLVGRHCGEEREDGGSEVANVHR